MKSQVRKLDKVSPETRSKCFREGILTCQDVVELNKLELLDKLEIPLKDIDELIFEASSKIAPLKALKNVKKMDVEQSVSSKYLKTKIKEFDEMLKGGIPKGSVTEIVGSSGVGKTQFCYTISIESAWDMNVLYIDTENVFSAKRLKEIFKNRYNNPTIEEFELLMNRIKFETRSSVKDLKSEIENLENNVLDNDIGLVIVDSIAAPIILEYGKQIWKRQVLLNEIASILKKVAENCKIAVVVTNHMTTGKKDVKQFFEKNERFTMERGGSERMPALGNTWAHCVNTRIQFDLVSDVIGAERKMTIVKSPMCAVVSLMYKIEKRGIHVEKEKDTTINPPSKLQKFD